MTAPISTAVDEPVDLTVRPRQLWVDLEAAAKTEGRVRLLRVIAVAPTEVLLKVESDTHPSRRVGKLTKVARHRMLGNLHLRRYELVEDAPRA